MATTTQTLNRVQIGFLGEALAASLTGSQLDRIADRIAERLMEERRSTSTDWMTTAEVAASVGQTPKTIRGKLKAIKGCIRGPKGWLFPREGVIAAVNAGLL